VLATISSINIESMFGLSVGSEPGPSPTLFTATTVFKKYVP
jgi:hypothetical protein